MLVRVPTKSDALGGGKRDCAYLRVRVSGAPLVQGSARGMAPTMNRTMNEAANHLALLYSDGSMGILSPETTLDMAKAERVHVDHNETRPEHLTKIVRVRVDVIEIIPIGMTETSNRCLTCGREGPPP